MSDSGLMVTGVRYRCRNCSSTKTVYVSPREVDGEYIIDAHNVRLHRGRCETCGQERTHVADPEGMDLSLDAASEESWGGRQ